MVPLKVHRRVVSPLLLFEKIENKELVFCVFVLLKVRLGQVIQGAENPQIRGGGGARYALKGKVLLSFLYR